MPCVGAAMTEAADDVAALSYEAALAELDSLIQKLEGGSIPLDDAIAAYERGTRLAQHCGALLDRTERRVSSLVVSVDGRPREQPLDADTPAAATPTPTGAAEAEAEAEGLFDDARPARARRIEQVDPDDVPF